MVGKRRHREEGDSCEHCADVRRCQQEADMEGRAIEEGTCPNQAVWLLISSQRRLQSLVNNWAILSRLNDRQGLQHIADAVPRETLQQERRTCPRQPFYETFLAMARHAPHTSGRAREIGGDHWRNYGAKSNRSMLTNKIPYMDVSATNCCSNQRWFV